MLLKRLIVFLIRRRLKLRVGDFFIFNNQHTHSIYWFEKCCLMKMQYGIISKSNVSLNWLLNDKCKITNFKKDNFEACINAIDKEAHYARTKIHSPRSNNN